MKLWISKMNYTFTIKRGEVTITGNAYICAAEPENAIFHPWLDEYDIPGHPEIELTEAEENRILSDFSQTLASPDWELR